MFYFTPQERKFIALVIIIFIAGASVQLLLRRDIAPVRWFKSVRQFKININTARAEQFQILPGIGASLARRMVEYRQEHGLFKSLEDLQNVDGLTAKRFMHIKELIEL
jgi:competence ComEA-like helix-hairpin-helix protein